MLPPPPPLAALRAVVDHFRTHRMCCALHTETGQRLTDEEVVALGDAADSELAALEAVPTPTTDHGEMRLIAIAIRPEHDLWALDDAATYAQARSTNQHRFVDDRSRDAHNARHLAALATRIRMALASAPALVAARATAHEPTPAHPEVAPEES